MIEYLPAESASLWSKIVEAPLSRISSTLSVVISVSRSMITSLRSIETTSPVSSSTKSSFQLFKTLAASLLPTAAFIFFLLTFNSSAKSNIRRISLSASYPIARSNVVTGNFFLRSIYAYITLLISVANSIQEPLNGIIRAEYNIVPFACIPCPKNTPGER